MRFQFIGLLASLLLLNLYYLVFFNYWFSFLFNITATLGIAVFLINIFSLLYSYKINKRVIYFALALYLIALFFLVLKLYTNHELKEEDYAPFVSNEDELGNIIKVIIYILFGSIFSFYCIVILKKINKEFYYHRLLKNWIYVFLILSTFGQVISVLSSQNKKNAFTLNDQEMAGFAKALSHPARIAILRILAEENSCICGEIVEVLPLAQSTVSQHLKELQEAGLVMGTVDGKKSCYCIHWENMDAFTKKLSGLFTSLREQKTFSCC
jgi:DNA-binding transcriptional ArsR family regulator